MAPFPPSTAEPARPPIATLRHMVRTGKIMRAGRVMPEHPMNLIGGRYVWCRLIRGLPDALYRIDLNGLRGAGYDVPGFTQAGRMFNMPGGGMEMQFPYAIPPEFISVVK